MSNGPSMESFLKNADVFAAQVTAASALYGGKAPPANDKSSAAELVRLAESVLGKPVPNLTVPFRDRYQSDMFDRGSRESGRQLDQLTEELKTAVYRLPPVEKSAVMARFDGLSKSPELQKQLGTGYNPTVTVTRGEATVRGVTADIVQEVRVDVDAVNLNARIPKPTAPAYPTSGKTRI